MTINNPVLDRLGQQFVERAAAMLELLRDEEIYPAVLLAVSGALRRGENLGATWQAFDPERKSLRITQAYYVVDGVADFDPVKNDNSEDTVYLTDFVVSELKRIRKEQMKMKLQLGAAWQDSNLICCRATAALGTPAPSARSFRRRWPATDCRSYVYTT